MKKRCLLAGLVFCLVGMTGCATAIDLDEEKEDMVAQYLAEKILYHDDNYTEALITTTPSPIPTMTPTPVTATPTVAATKPDSPSGTGSGKGANLQANADLTQVIGISGIQVEYTDYEKVDSFTESATVLEASKGNTLFVINFSAKNVSSKQVNMNLINKKIDYMLDINTEEKYRPLLNMKENDLSTIDVDLKPGEEQQMLLVFEVPKKMKLENANLVISKDADTAIIKLK